MATFFDKLIAETYPAVLKLDDNTSLTASLKTITDALGNATPLKISTVAVGFNLPDGSLDTFTDRVMLHNASGVKLVPYGSFDTGSIKNQNLIVQAGAKFRIDGVGEAGGFKIPSPVALVTPAAKIAVFDSSGNIQFRTPAEILSDIAAAPAAGSPNYIQNRSGSIQPTSALWVGKGLFGTTTDDTFSHLQVQNIFRVGNIRTTVSSGGASFAAAEYYSMSNINSQNIALQLIPNNNAASSGSEITLYNSGAGGAALIEMAINKSRGIIAMLGPSPQLPLDIQFGTGGGGWGTVADPAVRFFQSKNTAFGGVSDLGYKIHANGAGLNGGVRIDAATGNVMLTTGAGGSNMYQNLSAGRHLWNNAADDGSTSFQFNGNLSLTSIGNKFKIKTGTNSSLGTASMAGSVASVANSNVTANSKIIPFSNDNSITGGLRVQNINPGVGFDIVSNIMLQSGTVGYLILDTF